MNIPGSFTERELKLAVPPRFRLPALPTLDGATAQADPPSRYITVFFDTPDRALAAWGAGLRHRSGEGWQLKLPDTGDRLVDRLEVAFPGEPGAVPQAAVELLAAYLRGRRVGISARTRTVRHQTTYVDDRGVAQVELVDDRVTALEPEAGRTLRQLEIELRDPEATDLLEDLATHLEDAGATPGDTRSKYVWALGSGAPAPEVIVPEVGPAVSVRDIVRAAIAAPTRQLIHADAAIRTGNDLDAVHQARIATRRLRSHLRTFADLVDQTWAGDLQAGLRAVGSALGHVRDTEVLADRLRSAAEQLHAPEAVDQVVGALGDRLAADREGLAEIMFGAPYLALLDRLVEASAAPKLRGDPGAPAAAALQPAVQRAWRRLRDHVRRSPDVPNDEALHRVRIEAELARYASEAIAPLAGRRAAAFARAAARLQDVLGEHQDAVVAWTWLHDASAEGRIGTFTAGELAALQLAMRDAARARWRKAWKLARRKRPSTW